MRRRPSTFVWSFVLMACVFVAILAPAAGILAAATVADWILSPLLVVAGLAVMAATLAFWNAYDRPGRF